VQRHPWTSIDVGSSSITPSLVARRVVHRLDASGIIPENRDPDDDIEGRAHAG
jgi:hypothetical protein